MSSSSSSTINNNNTNTNTQAQTKYPPPTSNPADSYTIRKKPWQVRVTPFEDILNHKYPGSGIESDPWIVDWIPNDPEDPQIWGSVYKWSTIVVVSIVTLAVALSSSAYSGGIEDLIIEFGASAELVTAGVSLFVVGFAFGPLVWAPLSEVYGRRIIFIISYAFLTLWTGLTCASKNIGSVLVFRFLAGLFGSSPLANAGGVVSDVLDANQRGLGMALFAAAPFLGPALGPISGGFLGLTSGWRWIEGFLAIFCGVLTVVLAVAVPETYAPTLLRQRAAKLSLATGKVYRFRADAKKQLRLSELFKTALLRPWKFLLFEPIVLILTIYVAIIYGTLYLSFSAYPIVFQQTKGWNTGVGGLAFLGVLVGVLISLVVTVVYINPQYIKTAKKKGGRAEPEDRLPPAIWAGVLLVIGLGGFAATDGPNIHWIAPIIFGAPFGCGMVVLFLAVLGYLIDTYTIYAASVLAANSVLRSLFGAAFPLFTADMYKALGIHWAAALPGFLAAACVPATVVFYRYGKSIRAKCKYAADAERQMAAIMAARMAQMKPKTVDDEEKQVGDGTPQQSVQPAEETGGIGKVEDKQEDRHEWTTYEALADRDEVDLEDDERMRLEELHRKFDYAKARPGTKRSWSLRRKSGESGRRVPGGNGGESADQPDLVEGSSHAPAASTISLGRVV